MKNIILTYIIFQIATLSLVGQKRVHLAHGLSGTVDSWGEIEGIMDLSCPDVITTNGTYNSTDGIGAYENDFVNAQSGASSNDDIAIGHSFGGIALRSMDQNNNGLFGGYITVASPHAGAQLANSVNDGLLENYLEEGCFEVIDDPINAATNTLLSSPLTFIFGLISLSIDAGTTVLCNNLWEAALLAEGWLGNPFTGNNGATIDDLEVGGAGSNLPPSTLPSVGITGQLPENDEAHWRLIEDRTGSDVTATMQDVEDEFRNIADELIAISGTFRVRWWNPVSWLFGGLRTGLLNTATELNQGANWLGASEGGWMELIGAGGVRTLVIETVEVPAFEPCMSDGECGDNEKCIAQQCVPIDGGPCDVPPQQTTTIQIERWVWGPDIPNDGVVTVPSQQLPGSLRTTARNNVSHFGEQTDGGVQGAISDQFQVGTPPVDDVFRINNCQF